MSVSKGRVHARSTRCTRSARARLHLAPGLLRARSARARCLPILVTLAAGLLAAPVALAQAAGTSSCIACHGELEGALADPVKQWKGDVHGEAGLGCEGCHGGDPSPALASDAEAAMSPGKGFRPKPGRLTVPDFCGKCHSDPEFMKRFDPQARVDQLTEYRTSVHGALNARGDPGPAVCVDCHGAHGVRPVTSPESSAYATNVPKTCAKCHEDATLMARYGRKTGQYAEYRRSVHAAALLDRSDTAAPACNDCHGNHGATPPGVASISQVCGQCHGREATLFRASFKKDLFDGMNVEECSVCHGHHRIDHPVPELFHGPTAPAVSQGRVTGDDPFSAEVGEIAPGGSATAKFHAVLRPHAQAEDPRLEHRIVLSADGLAPLVVDATVRPGVADLSVPRVATSAGITASLGVSAPSGLPVEPGDALLYSLEIRASGPQALRQVKIASNPSEAVQSLRGSVCLQCHTPGDACDQASERMYDAITALDGRLRSSAAMLRRAEVAGMEVSNARFELKSKGITAAVEARALIHAFDPDRLVKRSEEGQAVAEASRKAGEDALAELEYRRKGLAVSLVLVGAVLLALWLKIRQVG